MKIYTKTGDKGETGLIGGERILKSELRLHAYGEVDEANAALGVALSAMGTDNPEQELLLHIQNDLFRAGAELATPSESSAKTPCEFLSENNVTFLEDAIDRMEKGLPPLSEFILPGGSPGGSHLHYSRTVVRRAERACVALHETEPLSEILLQYLNRLSDLLFVLARLENKRAGVADIPWKK